MYDVAVVGAGPAGCAAAIHLARMGRFVLLVERSPAPRRKACGEGLFPRGVAELERLGVLKRLIDSSEPIRGLRFHAGNSMAEARLGSATRPAMGMRRGELERELMAEARRAGVDVRDGAAVAGLVVRERTAAGIRLRTNEAVEARLVIAADGLQSPLRRAVGLDRQPRGDRYGVAAHVRMANPPAGSVEVYFEDGYELYLTPVGDGLVNAAVLTRKEGMARFAGRLEDGYRELLAGHPAMADGFEVADRVLAAGPFASGARQAYRANVLLAGDAAGFFDGISGEGMSLALVSGRLAANAADEWLSSGSASPLRAYDRELARLRRNSELVARLSLVLGRWPWMACFAVGRLANPEAFTKLAAISSGEAGWATFGLPELSGLALRRHRG